MIGLSGRTIELDKINESEQDEQSSAVSEAVPEMAMAQCSCACNSCSTRNQNIY